MSEFKLYWEAFSKSAGAELTVGCVWYVSGGVGFRSQLGGTGLLDVKNGYSTVQRLFCWWGGEMNSCWNPMQMGQVGDAEKEWR